MAKVYSIQLDEALGETWFPTLTQAKHFRNRLLTDGEYVGDITIHDAVTVIESQAARIAELEQDLREILRNANQAASESAEKAYWYLDQIETRAADALK